MDARRMFVVTIGQRADSDLTGLRILVVEDDYFIASEICSALSRSGAEVIGPAPDVQRGLEMLRGERVDCAVLDINLRGEMVFQLARELKQRGIPSIFATGYDGSVIPPDLAGLLCLEKPIDLKTLLRTISATCSARNERVSDL